MRGHEGDDSLPGDISDELGTALQDLGHKLHKESPSGRRSQSQQSARASPWECEGSKEAGPKALQSFLQGRAQRCLCSLVTSTRYSAPQGPPSASSGTWAAPSTCGRVLVPPTLPSPREQTSLHNIVFKE